MSASPTMPAPRRDTSPQPSEASHRLASGGALAPARASRAASALGRSLAGIVLAGLVACAASSFDGQVFRKGEVAFRLEHLPPSWRRVEINDTALAFRDEDNAATVAVNGRCGKDAEDVPLQSLTQHLFLQFTERQLTAQEVFPLDGREALRTEMLAKLDGVPKYFHVVVLKKDGCVYDFLQIANQQQDSDQFLDFVRGFTSLA